MNRKIDNIYIVHALKNYEKHEKRLHHILPPLGIRYNFVTKGDPTLITDNVLEKYFCSYIKSKLKIGILSCTLNHIYCYEELINNNQDLIIVFENDPFFLGDFRNKLDLILNELIAIPPGFIISLENTTLRRPKRSDLITHKYLYPAKQGRAAGAYIIDRKAVENILEDLESNKCCEVIDWWHNDLIDRNIIKMYWAYPVLTEQGSHNGKMHAVISSKQSSVLRELRWNIQKLYKWLLWRIRN